MATGSHVQPGPPGGGRPYFNLRAALPRYFVTLAFALGMANVEAAAVLYLRTIYGGIDPVAPRQPPLTPVPDFLLVEVAREAATMLMLATVGWLAGGGSVGRTGAFIAAFGAWDLGYYAFLWLFTGWPGSLLAPDILFLIPLPWWGPVVAPMLLALMMVIVGGLGMARELGDGMPPPDPPVWFMLWSGVGLCLVAFMWDAILALPAGLQAVFGRHGADQFPWLIFLPGAALILAGCLRAIRRVAAR